MRRIAWLVLLAGACWATPAQGDFDDDIKNLGSVDEAIRRNAAASLAKQGKEALPKLTQILKQAVEKKDDGKVKPLLQVIAAIGPDPEDADLRGLVINKILKIPDFRPDATALLAKMGKDGAAALGNLLNDKNNDDNAKISLLRALGSTGPEAKKHVKQIRGYLGIYQYRLDKGKLVAVRDAKSAVVANSKEIRTAAIEALGRIKEFGQEDELVMKELKAAASSKNKEIVLRFAAIVALFQILPAKEAPVKAQAALIKDDAAWKAVTPLLAAQGSSAVPFLKLGLESTDPAVRFNVLVAMATAMKPEDLGGDIAKAVGPSLKDDDGGIRRKAVEVLNRMALDNIKDAIPQIAEALDDKNAEIRGIALGIIRKLGADPNNARFAASAALNLATLLKRPEKDIRDEVLRVLNNAGDGGAVAAGALLTVIAEDKSLVVEVGMVLDKYGIKALPAYLDALKAENPAVKVMAAERIGKLGALGREASEALKLKLGDPAKEVRDAAIDALSKIGIDLVPALRDQLKDKNVATRTRAAEMLGELGPKAKIALPEILAALTDQEPAVRLQVVRAVKKVGDAKTVAPNLIKLLDDSSIRVRQAVASVLEEAGPEAKDGVPGLTRMLRANDKAARQQAVLALKAIGPAARAAVPELVRLLMDSDPEVRNAAIQALGKIGADARDAVPALIVLFKDKDDAVRSMAASAIADIGPPAIPVLTEALRYDDKDVRQFAVVSLVNMGPKAKDAVKDVAAALKDKEAEVRKGAALSLKEIGADTLPVLQSLVDAVKDSESDVRVNMILTLATLAPTQKPAISGMCQGLKDKEDLVRGVALEAVGKLGPLAIPALIDALKDPDKKSKLGACELLEKLGGAAKPALPALNEAAKDKDDEVRAAALKALEKVK